MSPTEPGRIKEPTYGGHISHMCSHFVAFNIFVHLDDYPRRSIQRRSIWLISGRDQTNGSGEEIVHMNDYLDFPICEDPHWRYVSPAIIGSRPEFIATPESDTPVVLTSKLEISEKEGRWIYLDLENGSYIPGVRVEFDVKVKVKSWGLDGAPAAHTIFSWICIAEAGLQTEPMV